jgi:hypothetical protein
MWMWMSVSVKTKTEGWTKKDFYEEKVLQWGVAMAWLISIRNL